MMEIPKLRIRNRRKPEKYTERLTTALVWVSALGAGWVILDPVIIIPLPYMEGSILKLGASGFSNDLKGTVIGTVIIGTIVAVLKFWLDRNDDRVEKPVLPEKETP